MKNNKSRLFEEYNEKNPKNKESDKKEKNEKKVEPVFIDNYGKDLTKLAKEGKLEPIIGREKEIEQIILILSRKLKNNPVIVGEAGVGKTAIVEGISQIIVGSDCPDTLKGKRIVYMDMGTIMGVARSQGIENVAKILLKELEDNKNILLFIDEIHMIVDKNLPIDFSNLIKPALARGDMRCIGATTYNEYRNSIEKDGALERRFQIVRAEQPSVEETIDILNKIKPQYEKFHKIKYSEESIKACVKLSDRYMTDRFFPDKAIDLMDEAGAKARISAKSPKEVKDLELELSRLNSQKDEYLQSRNYEGASEVRRKYEEMSQKLKELLDKDQETSNKVTINKNDIAVIVSRKTGIPVSDISGVGDDNEEREKEIERVKVLGEKLKIDIIGQDEAVNKITKCIRRSKVGLKDPNRPTGVFLFLGSTGTGKTHTVKMLAKHLFGSESNVIRVDMSEYGEKHNVSRMIGSPPGYVGYSEGGQLTEQVRRKPYSVVLFDEIEKAHPDVLNIMLQIFDDGHLTDGSGKKINFKNTLIIMTSNIGSQAVNMVKNIPVIRKIGFGVDNSQEAENKQKQEQSKDIIMNELRMRLKPEFINRIDDIIIFSQLSQDNIYKIIDNEIIKTQKRLEDMGYELELTINAKDLLIEKGYDSSMGARPLKRAIQNYIDDPITDQIIDKKIDGKKIVVDYDKSAKKITINGVQVNESKRRIITKFNIFL
jgi:ATP-dependent Clp protease ATP-binding subunit ClpC